MTYSFLRNFYAGRDCATGFAGFLTGISSKNPVVNVDPSVVAIVLMFVIVCAGFIVTVLVLEGIGRFLFHR